MKNVSLVSVLFSAFAVSAHGQVGASVPDVRASLHTSIANTLQLSPADATTLMEAGQLNEVVAALGLDFAAVKQHALQKYLEDSLEAGLLDVDQANKVADRVLKSATEGRSNFGRSTPGSKFGSLIKKGGKRGKGQNGKNRRKGGGKGKGGKGKGRGKGGFGTRTTNRRLNEIEVPPPIETPVYGPPPINGPPPATPVSGSSVPPSLPTFAVLTEGSAPPPNVEVPPSRFGNNIQKGDKNGKGQNGKNRRKGGGKGKGDIGFHKTGRFNTGVFGRLRSAVSKVFMN